MKQFPHPGYEGQWQLSLAGGLDAVKKVLFAYTLPGDMEMVDETIPAAGERAALPVRVYRKKGLSGAPIVMNIHGGGFSSGTLDNDNARCLAIAGGADCVVVSVAYTLVPKAVYPTQLLECHAALQWVADNAIRLGGDGVRFGLHGTSAGGNLAAALALYVRDHGGPDLSLVALNVPLTDDRITGSVYQNYEAPVLSGKMLTGKNSAGRRYEGDLGGAPPPCYLYPGRCENCGGLPPHLIICGEYDPLRDCGMDYARRLMEWEVPCELYVMPRVGHGFDMVDAPLTKWIREGMCNSFRREFGMLKA